MMSDSNQMIRTQFEENIQKSAGPIIAMGILLLVIGVIAMGSPFVAGLSLVMMIGILLIIGGIGQVIFAFKSGKILLPLALGVLTIAIGGYILSHPGAALASLTLFLAMFLVFSGALEVVMSFQFRPIKGWGWAAFSGILSMLLGFMIWKQFPLSGAWAVGILLGVRLFLNGFTLLMLGIAAKKQ